MFELLLPLEQEQEQELEFDDPVQLHPCWPSQLEEQDAVHPEALLSQLELAIMAGAALGVTLKLVLA